MGFLLCHCCWYGVLQFFNATRNGEPKSLIFFLGLYTLCLFLSCSQGDSFFFFFPYFGFFALTSICPSTLTEISRAYIIHGSMITMYHLFSLAIISRLFHEYVGFWCFGIQKRIYIMERRDITVHLLSMARDFPMEPVHASVPFFQILYKRAGSCCGNFKIVLGPIYICMALFPSPE